MNVVVPQDSDPGQSPSVTCMDGCVHTISLSTLKAISLLDAEQSPKFISPAQAPPLLLELYLASPHNCLQDTFPGVSQKHRKPNISHQTHNLAPKPGQTPVFLESVQTKKADNTYWALPVYWHWSKHFTCSKSLSIFTATLSDG